jgi:hypothetical protein
VARARTIAIVSVATVLAVGAAGGGAYYLLHTRGTPAETAQRFAAAWQAGDWPAMGRELAKPQQLGAYAQQRSGLSVERTSIRLGKVVEGDGRASVPYTATLAMKNIGDWSYEGQVDLVVADRTWNVDWTPKTLYPSMTGCGSPYTCRAPDLPRRGGVRPWERAVAH